MKSVKTMLLGIAFLIIACCGYPIMMHGNDLGVLMFYGGLIAGVVLCFKGFFRNDD